MGDTVARRVLVGGDVVGHDTTEHHPVYEAPADYGRDGGLSWAAGLRPPMGLQVCRYAGSVQTTTGPMSTAARADGRTSSDLA